MTRAQCDELARGLESSSVLGRRLFETHTAAELGRRPRPEAWSAAECVAHLSLTAAAVVPLVEAALRELREKGRRSASRSRMDWTGRLLAWALEPRWLRSRTLPRFVPAASSGPTDDVLDEFLKRQDEILGALRSAEGLDLAAASITSPFNERVHYNVLSAFRILETHERRHLRQAQAALGG